MPLGNIIKNTTLNEEYLLNYLVKEKNVIPDKIFEEGLTMNELIIGIKYLFHESNLSTSAAKEISINSKDTDNSSMEEFIEVKYKMRKLFICMVLNW